MVNNVSLDVRQGEIVCLYGLMGAGRTELMEALFGLTRATSGEATLDGKPIGRSARECIEQGLVLVPEDRQQHGVFGALLIQQNVALPSLGRLARGVLLDEEAEERLARQVAERLAIKHASLGQSVSELSGGNQQKVVIGKWLAAESRLFIFDEPTRGIDVGAKAEIFSLMYDLVQNGAAVLMISSELSEIVNVCDRAYVMREGRIAGELSRDRLTEENILSLGMHHE